MTMESDGTEWEIKESARHPVRNPGVAELIQHLGIVARSLSPLRTNTHRKPATVPQKRLD